LKNPEQYFGKKACKVEKEFILCCGPTEEVLLTSNEEDAVDVRGIQIYII